VIVPFVDRVPDTKQNMYEANEVWSSLKKLAKYKNAKQQINTTVDKIFVYGFVRIEWDNATGSNSTEESHGDRNQVIGCFKRRT